MSANVYAGGSPVFGSHIPSPQWGGQRLTHRWRVRSGRDYTSALSPPDPSVFTPSRCLLFCGKADGGKKGRRSGN